MKISCVVVTYNPSEKFSKNIRRVLEQVEKVYIIDNHSNVIDKLEELEKSLDCEKIEIIYNKENEGLARAQNIGIEKSCKEGYEWILLLDDDSRIEDMMVQEMFNSYTHSENRENIGMIGPNILHEDSIKKTAYPIETSFFIKRCFLEGKDLENVNFIISSGSLIKADLFKKIGLLKEDFFIDHIDVEFCMRAIVNNFKILVSNKAILHQRVGNTTLKKILIFNFFPTNHNPKRQYTKFRNAILTWKIYFFKKPKYVIYDFLLMTNHSIRVLLFEKNKLEHFKYMFKGIKEAIFN